MHDLLSEEELQEVHVLVVINYKKKEYDEFKLGEKLQIEELEDNTADMHDDTKDHLIFEEIEKNIYYHLIPQMNKQIFPIDIFDEKVSASDHQKTRTFFKQFVSMLD